MAKKEVFNYLYDTMTKQNIELKDMRKQWFAQMEHEFQEMHTNEAGYSVKNNERYSKWNQHHLLF